MTIWHWIVCFFIYCGIGWAFESTVVSISEKRWVNRGFFFGPICPIYGTCAIALAVLLTPFEGSWALTYLASVLICTTVELAVGFGMEKLFHARWWDYSNKRFNFRGYICLSSSLVWGLMAMVLVKLLHPRISGWLVGISPLPMAFLCGAILALFAVDAVFSLRAAVDLSAWAERFTQFRSEWDAKLQNSLSRANTKKEERSARFASIRAGLNLPDGQRILNAFRMRTLRAYPKLRSTRFPEAMEEMRARMHRIREEIHQWRKQRAEGKDEPSDD